MLGLIKQKAKTISVSTAVLAGLLLGGCSIAEKEDGGVYKSVDGGEEWKQVVDIEESELTLASEDIVGLTGSPFDPSTVYLATKSAGFYVSHNYGDSWKRMLSQISSVYDLKVNPFRDKVAYASVLIKSRGKIIRTDDGGDTWREIHTETATGTYIQHIAVSPHEDRVILAANSQGFLMRTDNDGEDWQGMHNFEEPLTNILFDGNDKDVVWALNDDGVWRSDNKGKEFTPITEEQEELEEVGDYYLLSSSRGKLFLSTDEGFFKSNDKGGSWEKIYTLNNPSQYPVKVFTAFPGKDGHWAVGAGMTLYLTEDAGVSWKSVQFETERTISSVHIKRDDAKSMLVGAVKEKDKGILNL